MHKFIKINDEMAGARCRIASRVKRARLAQGVAQAMVLLWWRKQRATPGARPSASSSWSQGVTNHFKNSLTRPPGCIPPRRPRAEGRAEREEAGDTRREAAKEAVTL